VFVFQLLGYRNLHDNLDRSIYDRSIYFEIEVYTKININVQKYATNK